MCRAEAGGEHTEGEGWERARERERESSILKNLNYNILHCSVVYREIYFNHVKAFRDLCPLYGDKYKSRCFLFLHSVSDIFDHFCFTDSCTRTPPEIFNHSQRETRSQPQMAPCLPTKGRGQGQINKEGRDIGHRL